MVMGIVFHAPTTQRARWHYGPRTPKPSLSTARRKRTPRPGWSFLVVTKVRSELTRGCWSEPDHVSRSRLISPQAIPDAPLRASAARFSISSVSSIEIPGQVLQIATCRALANTELRREILQHAAVLEAAKNVSTT